MVKLFLIIIVLIALGSSIGLFIGSRVNRILDNLAKEDGSGDFIDKVNETGDFPPFNEIQF